LSRLKDLQRQVGFNKETVRSPADFYITPNVAVIELLKRERFHGLGWECASGNGSISKFFPNIISSDIRTDDSVFGDKGVDFLKTNRRVDYIITNPPFSLMLPFAKHALECANKVALFGRIQFLEGVERHRFFSEHPPIRVYVFSNRLSCSTDGIVKSDIMCFCWFIWEKGFHGQPSLDWILHGVDSNLEEVSAVA